MKKYVPIIFFAIFLFIIQQLISFNNCEYYLTQLIMTAYYSLVVIGLCLVMGYAGQISLGHAAFFSIAGYIVSFLNTYNLAEHISTSAFVQILVKLGLTSTYNDIYGATIIHINSFVAALIALLVTIIIAFCIGKPILKLKGHYLAMATLGFGVIIYRIVLGTKIFGQADGLYEVPPFKIGNIISISGDSSLRIGNYYFSWFLVIIGLIIIINLINSRVGRALRAIHDSEEAADTMGVDTAKYKVLTFVLSAAFAAIAGIGLTHYNSGIGPAEAGVIKSIRYVAIVAVGGMANLWGALFMGLILNYLSLRGYFGSYDDAVFGIILINIMIFAPKGILEIPFIKKLFKRNK